MEPLIFIVHALHIMIRKYLAPSVAPRCGQLPSAGPRQKRGAGREQVEQPAQRQESWIRPHAGADSRERGGRV